MTRFNTPDDVKAWAEKVAAQDLERHRKFGIDLNPYCTPGAQNDWQRGFDNAPPWSWESATTLDFCTKYQRGRAMARLLDQQPDREDILWLMSPGS